MYFYTVFMHIRSSHCPGLNPLLCSSILCHEECSSKYCMLLWCNIDVNNKRNPSSALVIFNVCFAFVDGQQREAQLNEGKMKHLSTLFHIAQCDARNQSHWCCHNFFLCFNAIFCEALLIKKGKIFLGKSNYNNKTEKVVMFWWTYRWNKKKKIHAHPHHYMGQVLKKCINTKNELTAGVLQNASFIYLLHINSV